MKLVRLRVRFHANSDETESETLTFQSRHRKRLGCLTPSEFFYDRFRKLTPVAGDSLVGLAIGYNYNTTMADYYYLEIDGFDAFGLNNSGGVATGKTASEMQTSAFVDLLGDAWTRSDSENVPPEKRDVSSLTVAIDRWAFEDIRALAREFRKALQKRIDQVTAADRVYHINLQMVPVSHCSSDKEHL